MAGPLLGFLVLFLPAFEPPVFARSRYRNHGGVDFESFAQLVIALLQGLQHVGIFWIGVDAEEFVRVGDKVEQVPFSRYGEEHELVLSGAHTVVSRHYVGALAIVGVVDGVPPVAGNPALVLQHREDAGALNLSRAVDTCHLQKRGRVVDVLNHRVRGGATFDHLGPANEEGHLQ